MVMTVAAVQVVVVVAVAGALVVSEPRLDTLPCGPTTMVPGERVAVQSANFPNTYNSDDRCQYEITCNPRDSTYLKFICPVFDLESSADCINDRLIVTFKGSKDTLCGTDSPNGTITTDGWTRLTFRTNNDVVAPGYRCYIWCWNQPTTAAPTTTTTTTTVAPTTTTTTTTAAPTTTTTTTTAAPTTTTTTTAAPTTTTTTTTTAAPTTTTTAPLC